MITRTNKAKIFTAKSSSKHQFLKDPIHNEINFEGETLWMHKLLDTSEFKRLKNIKQLGLSALFFPGATHTRASHCLGAYEVMRQMLLNPSFKWISKEDRLTLLCAALLHDLGHGPHSHAFEDYFASSFSGSSGHQRTFSHEYFSVQFITNERGSIAPLLLKNNVDPLKVASLIDVKNKVKEMPVWMTQLMSSELDVDRIDYLLRDSYYSGANYGIIDSKALIHWAYFDKGNNRVSFAKKAIPLIENFLVGRYHMYQSVYFNEKTSLLVMVLWFAFKRIKELDQANNFEWNNFNYIRDTLRVMFNKKGMDQVQLSDYILMNDHTFETFLQTTYMTCKDEILRKILDSYFYENQYLIFFFSTEKIRDEYYNKLEQQKLSQYNVLKYDYPTKKFYSPSQHSTEITVYDDKSKKSVAITRESELIRQGNNMFTKNHKHRFGILVHRNFLKNSADLMKMLKL